MLSFASMFRKKNTFQYDPIATSETSGDLVAELLFVSKSINTKIQIANSISSITPPLARNIMQHLVESLFAGQFIVKTHTEILTGVECASVVQLRTKKSNLKLLNQLELVFANLNSLVTEGLPSLSFCILKTLKSIIVSEDRTNLTGKYSHLFDAVNEKFPGGLLLTSTQHKPSRDRSLKLKTC